MFLDLNKDRYVQLDKDISARLEIQLSPAHCAASLSRAGSLAGALEKGDSGIEALLRLGLVTTDRHRGKRFSEMQKAARLEILLLLPEERASIGFADLCNFFRSYLAALIRLRLFGIKSAVKRVEIAKRRAIAADFTAAAMMELRQRTEIFKRLKPIAARASDECLLNSLALYEFLSAYGFQPQFCIGVRLHNFSAHAWVQAGGYLLDDAALVAASHKPLLTF
ncbi:MAG: lasso peptide biosynthesis B2 protein [Oricola sp.]|nr:lasso peptide biosynthesis B2 protein [Oricola sp.]